MRLIESTKNQFVKQIIHLEKARERKKSGLFLIEGFRELNLALLNGYEITHILFCADFISESDCRNQVAENKAEWLQVSAEVADKIFYRNGVENVLGITKYQKHSLQHIKLKENPLILLIENTEKPGNLGAMLRTADAAGADAVIICDNSLDIYNPNVIRSSLGCLFSLQVAQCTTAEAIAWCKAHHINTYAAHLQAEKFHYEYDYTTGTAFAMGSEAEGLSETWWNQATERIKIPMLGQHDSMNVSNAAAVLLYEAVRQRAVKTT